MQFYIMEFWITAVILSLLSCTYETASIGHTDLCNKIIFKLSLFSQRDNSGKWETQVHLNRDNNTEVSENEKDFHLDVKQTVATCNCSKDVLSVEANIVAPPPRPGKSYTFHHDLGYYLLQRSPLASEDANVLCNSEGAHLAVVNSKEKAVVISKMIQNITGQDNSPDKLVFIGLYKNVGGQVITIFGATYQQPDGVTLEKVSDRATENNSADLCGAINYKGNINFVSCHLKLSSMCEQEL